ncbi:hypothetical protein [Streptosporangium sp. CA-115845]|uniref:hypothetical protein n=1 Tax=Streptosporangium sp. CA-115845 TaxID=3240071 RepID=UPI003D8C1CDB
MKHSRLRAALVALMAVLPVLVIPATAEAQGSTTIPRSHWAYVSSKHQNRTHWQEDRVFVGFQEKPKDITRAFFQLDLTPVADVERITEAWFGVGRANSWECGRRDVELWETGDIDSSTTWKNQPKWERLLLATPGGTCLDRLHFRITSAVREAVAAGKDHITLGLKSIDETNPEIRHELWNDGNLAVTHNDRPDLPAETSVTSDYESCQASPQTGRYVNSITPWLGAKLSDPDRNSYPQVVRGRFEWTTQDGTKLGEKVTDVEDSGTRHCVMVPAGQLVADSSYRWRVRAEDPYKEDGELHYDIGEWTPWQEFTVDLTAPAQPPLVSSTDYPQDVPSGHVHLPGAFTFTPNGADDIVAYSYGLDGAYEHTPAAADGSVTVTVKPSRDSTNCLRVRGFDRAGNFSPDAEYCFEVNRLEHPPTVSSSTYPEFGGGGEPGGGVGIPGEFVFDAGDLRDIVTVFRYSYNDAPTEEAPAENGLAKTTITPTQTDWHTVYADALDRDGTVVWSYTYSFEVKTG